MVPLSDGFLPSRESTLTCIHPSAAQPQPKDWGIFGPQIS